MKRKVTIFALFIFIMFNCQAQTINLLFLGNSFTANTQLNVTVKAMINAGTSGKTVNLSDAVILYGQNLDAHWKNATSRTKVQSGSYTYVILQGYINNGYSQAADTATKYGTLFAAEAKAHSEIPIIFSHQANCDAIQTNWDNITNPLRALAVSSGSIFAPAGLSWLQAKTMDASIVTHDPDCHHQNDISNYLNACVFYYIITGQSPVGNTYRTSNLTTIDETTALILQQAAVSVVDGETGTKVSSVSIAPATISIPEKTTTQLTANVLPADAGNKSVIWTSNNPGVASVSISGLVTAVSAGTATITATSVNGSINSTSEVTVVGYTPPPSNNTSFRYLKYELGSGGDIYIFEIEWMSGATAYPTVKATSGSHANITATFPGPGWNTYWMCFDGISNSSNMWAPPKTYPSPVTIDLGAAGAILPTAINVTTDKYHYPTSFKCLASNDNSNWYLLFEKTGMVADDWGAAVPTTFTFAAQISDNQAPAVPSGLTSSNVTKTSFTLAWAESTDNVGGVGGVNYEVFKDGVSVGSTTLTSFEITDLTASTSYAMTVKAKDGAIPSNISVTSSALNVKTRSADTLFSDGDFITLAPLGGVFTSGSNNKEFFHTQMGTNYATKITSGGNPANAISMGANGCQILLSIPAPASAQTWTIAYDQKITGAVTTGPNLKAFGLTTGQTIPYAIGGGTGGTTLFTQLGTGIETVWTHKSYTVNVSTGFNDIVFEWFADAAEMLIDNVVVTVNSVPDTQEPTAPTALASSAITQSGFTLSWTASTDNIGVTSYEVFNGTTSCGTTASTSLSITGLTAATPYSMTVKARDAAGNVSNASATLNVTTSAILDTQAPTAPTSLASSAISQTGFTLSWAASTDNVGVVSYEVFRGTTSCGITTSTSLDITGLTAATAYVMTVKAKDAAGNVSVASTAINVTTSKVGIDSPSNSTSVYPNPAGNFVWLDLGINESASIELMNIDGRHICIKNNISGAYQLNLEPFEEGLYLIKIVKSNSTEIIKIFHTGL